MHHPPTLQMVRSQPQRSGYQNWTKCRRSVCVAFIKQQYLDRQAQGQVLVPKLFARRRSHSEGICRCFRRLGCCFRCQCGRRSGSSAAAGCGGGGGCGRGLGGLRLQATGLAAQWAAVRCCGVAGRPRAGSRHISSRLLHRWRRRQGS